MREIKCRGLNTKGEWVYGSLVNTTHGIATMPHTRTKTWIVESAFGNGGWFNVTRKQYVKPETVGQFTGKYFGGDEIYEGDIVSDHVGIGVVKYSEKDGAFRVSYGDGQAKWFYDYILNGERESIEVIGNVHENPELMEQAEC